MTSCRWLFVLSCCWYTNLYMFVISLQIQYWQAQLDRHRLKMSKVAERCVWFSDNLAKVFRSDMSKRSFEQFFFFTFASLQFVELHRAVRRVRPFHNLTWAIKPLDVRRQYPLGTGSQVCVCICVFRGNIAIKSSTLQLKKKRKTVYMQDTT